jgi:single-strand DNA-binding protein
MAKDLNRVTLTGRLGKDVDLRVTPNGSAIASFSVASSRNFKEGDAWKEQTEWFRVVAWEKLAETCANYLHKGSRVLIEGRLQTREYTDKEGIKRYSTEVIASDLIMLDTKKDNNQEEAQVDTDWDKPAVVRPSARPSANAAVRPSRSQTTTFEDEADFEDIPF